MSFQLYDQLGNSLIPVLNGPFNVNNGVTAGSCADNGLSCKIGAANDMITIQSRYFGQTGGTGSTGGSTGPFLGSTFTFNLPNQRVYSGTYAYMNLDSTLQIYSLQPGTNTPTLIESYPNRPVSSIAFNPVTFTIDFDPFEGVYMQNWLFAVIHLNAPIVITFTLPPI